jgi:hypothetical protein
MKTFLTFIFLGLLQTNLLANTDKDTSFTISGNMVGFKDSTEVKLEDQNTNVQLASARIIKGKFTLKGKLAEPTLCWLKIAGDEDQYIYVENKTISVTGIKPIRQTIK